MKNDVDINLQLRSEILEIALNLEASVDELLLALLSIEIPKRKAISNKSGSLSFKNKIDLLFDLDVLISSEHQKLLLLMVFRNQFLHNIKCCSFEDTVKHLGVDQGKKLLKFNDKDNSIEKESQYQNAFRNLSKECFKILLDKTADRMNQVEDRRKIHNKLIESQIFFINKYCDVIVKLMMVCEHNISENPEVIQLINQLTKTLSDDQEFLYTSDEFIQIQGELQRLHTPEMLKTYFEK